MLDMTKRERFKAIMHFKKADRLPWYEFSWNEVIYRWIEQGLSIREIATQEEGLDVDGSMPYSLSYMTLDASRYFGFENFTTSEHNVVIDQCPIPRYFVKTLEETEDCRILRSIDGTVKKINKRETYSMPMWLDWPVKNQSDWNKLKERLDPTDPRRYPKEWNDEYIEYLKNCDSPISMWFGGFYSLGRTFMGTVPFLTAFYKDPELVKDMMDFQAMFIIESIRNAVEALKSSFDIIIIHEDMAYKHGPHISPKLFKQFILPGYKKVTGFLRKNNIDTIFIDCDGLVTPLIPLLLEGGVNGLYPLEVAAGMDAVALRKEYGQSLKLIGNIDKRALTQGKKAIKKEVETKIPYLKEAGGYIPTLDHCLPPDIPLEGFKFYSEIIKKHL